jgi:hypothetical protein
MTLIVSLRITESVLDRFKVEFIGIDSKAVVVSPSAAIARDIIEVVVDFGDGVEAQDGVIGNPEQIDAEKEGVEVGEGNFEDVLAGQS